MFFNTLGSRQSWTINRTYVMYRLYVVVLASACLHAWLEIKRYGIMWVVSSCPGQLIVGHDMYTSLLLVTQCVPNSRRIFVQKLFTPLVTIAYCIILPMLVQSVYTSTILYFECNRHSFLNPIWNAFLEMVVLQPHYTLNINGCFVKW